MSDLVSDSSNTQSPKRKFSFKFPHLTHHAAGNDKEASSSGHHKAANASKSRNFCEEIQNVPDLQVSDRDHCAKAFHIRTQCAQTTFSFFL